MTSQPNQVSQTSYDQNHSQYDQYRPGYIDECYQQVLDVCGITDASTVVEVAAGTGKFTSGLIERTKAKIIAVEPSSGMLESFKKKFPQVQAIQASSSATTLDTGCADAVIVAQGFHWFANDESLREFHRILKPGGTLCLVWNYEDFDRLTPDHWQFRTVKYCHTFDKGVPQYNHMKWPQAFENQQLFEAPVSEKKFPYDTEIPSKDFYWSQWSTRSYLTALGPEGLEKVHQQFENIMNESEPADGKLIAKRGVHVVWTRRL